MLKYFHFATIELEKKFTTLHDCRCVVDSLLEIINAEKRDINSNLYDCKLRPHRIAIDGPLSPNSDFESGVCKIQSNSLGMMTENEKTACKLLPRTSKKSASSVNEGKIRHSFYKTLERKRQKLEKKECMYINCDFILGSTAEIERLWSVAKNIMRDNRKHMEPILFEALIFLKVNRSYWDISSVQSALALTKEDGT